MSPGTPMLDGLVIYDSDSTASDEEGNEEDKEDAQKKEETSDESEDESQIGNELEIEEEEEHQLPSMNSYFDSCSRAEAYYAAEAFKMNMERNYFPSGTPPLSPEKKYEVLTLDLDNILSNLDIDLMIKEDEERKLKRPLWETMDKKEYQKLLLAQFLPSEWNIAQKKSPNAQEDDAQIREREELKIEEIQKEEVKQEEEVKGVQNL